MSLWGNRDLANNAPKIAVFGGTGFAGNGQSVYANTVIGAVNSGVLASVEGVTAAEKGNTAFPNAYAAAHAGWIATKVGTGPVIGVNIVNGGRHNAAGNIAFSGGNGTGAVATFGIGYGNTTLTGTANVTNGSAVVVGTGTLFAVELVANVDFITIGSQVLRVANVTSNTNVQTVSAFTTNANGSSIVRTTNTINSVTIVSGGSGFISAPTVTANAANAGSAASFQAVLGGRGGRVQTEVLVAGGSIT